MLGVGRPPHLDFLLLHLTDSTARHPMCGYLLPLAYGLEYIPAFLLASVISTRVQMKTEA